MTSRFMWIDCLGRVGCGGTGGGIVNDLVTRAYLGDGSLRKVSGTVPQNYDAAGPAKTRKDANFDSLMNDCRRSNGSSALAFNARLDLAVQGHASDMLVRDCFSHTSPEGLTVRDRIVAQALAMRLDQVDLEVGKVWLGMTKPTDDREIALPS